MKIKRRISRFYDDYTEFKSNPHDQEEARRVIKHYDYCNENGLLISPKLKESINQVIKIQSAGFPVKEKNKRGRPSSVEFNSYLAMLVWYRCNIDQIFHEKIAQSDMERYEVVAASLNETDSEVRRAAILDGDINKYRFMDSVRSVNRANSYFKKFGFSSTSSRQAEIENEIQAETFCICVLHSTPLQAAHHKEVIIKFWKESLKKSQGQ